MNLDYAPDPDTCTLEHYRRVNEAAGLERRKCVYCGGPLKPVQIRRRGRFCTPQCAGRWQAQEEYGKPATPKKERPPVGLVNDLIGDQYDVTTGEPADRWQPDALTKAIRDVVSGAVVASGRWTFSAQVGDLTITVNRGGMAS